MRFIEHFYSKMWQPLVSENAGSLANGIFKTSAINWQAPLPLWQWLHHTSKGAANDAGRYTSRRDNLGLHRLVAAQFEDPGFDTFLGSTGTRNVSFLVGNPNPRSSWLPLLGSRRGWSNGDSCSETWNMPPAMPGYPCVWGKKLLLRRSWHWFSGGEVYPLKNICDLGNTSKGFKRFKKDNHGKQKQTHFLQKETCFFCKQNMTSEKLPSVPWVFPVSPLTFWQVLLIRWDNNDPAKWILSPRKKVETSTNPSKGRFEYSGHGNHFHTKIVTWPLHTVPVLYFIVLQPLALPCFTVGNFSSSSMSSSQARGAVKVMQVQRSSQCWRWRWFRPWKCQLKRVEVGRNSRPYKDVSVTTWILRISPYLQ